MSTAHRRGPDSPPCLRFMDSTLPCATARAYSAHAATTSADSFNRSEQPRTRIALPRPTIGTASCPACSSASSNDRPPGRGCFPQTSRHSWISISHSAHCLSVPDRPAVFHLCVPPSRGLRPSRSLPSGDTRRRTPPATTDRPSVQLTARGLPFGTAVQISSRGCRWHVPLFIDEHFTRASDPLSSLPLAALFPSFLPFLFPAGSAAAFFRPHVFFRPARCL